MTSSIQFLLKRITADYRCAYEDIIRIGRLKDIAAHAAGNFVGESLFLCHGNGETVVYEKYRFNKLIELVVVTFLRKVRVLSV